MISTLGKSCLAAVIFAAANLAAQASNGETLPPQITAALESAARVRRTPNNTLYLTVIAAIAERPKMLESIIGKAIELAPHERYALAYEAAASFPGHANRILAAAGYFNQAPALPPAPIQASNPPSPQVMPAPAEPPPPPAQEPMAKAAPLQSAASGPKPEEPLAPAQPPEPEEGQNQGFGIISEARGGIMYHSLKISHQAKERGADANIEVLFNPPRFLDILWSPRPHAGASFNDRAKDTDQVYAGLTWEWAPWRSVFLDFSFGATVWHNGAINTNAINGVRHPDAGRRRELGCDALFRESLEFGYRITGKHSISAMWDHISHGSMCSDDNEGMDNAGIRYGYRF